MTNEQIEQLTREHLLERAQRRLECESRKRQERYDRIAICLVKWMPWLLLIICLFFTYEGYKGI